MYQCWYKIMYVYQYLQIVIHTVDLPLFPSSSHEFECGDQSFNPAGTSKCRVNKKPPLDAEACDPP